MGCDIHFHTEVKVNGKWEHYGHPYVNRNYSLFALLADVRNDGEIKPISKPKGLPVDPSIVTELAYKTYSSDWHSISWLSAEEIVRAEEQWGKHGWKDQQGFEHHLFGYLEGNSWAGFYKYPESRPKWIEDVRWVFWFDN